jgi:5'-nucleotidase
MEEKLPDGETGYAVSGTPADCARLGFMTLAKDLDLLVSGINLDCNLGYDVNYSGTVAAALEAAGAGFPAIAASLEKSSRSDWPGAGAILADVIQKMPGYELPKGIMLNLNIPHSPRNLEPVWTAACNEPALDYFSRNELSPGTSQYIRCRGYGLELGPDSVPEKLDNDVSLIRAGYITLSPLTKVSVHEETLRRLSGAS